MSTNFCHLETFIHSNRIVDASEGSFSRMTAVTSSLNSSFETVFLSLSSTISALFQDIFSMYNKRSGFPESASRNFDLKFICMSLFSFSFSDRWAHRRSSNLGAEDSGSVCGLVSEDEHPPKRRTRINSAMCFNILKNCYLYIALVYTKTPLVKKFVTYGATAS